MLVIPVARGSESSRAPAPQTCNARRGVVVGTDPIEVLALDVDGVLTDGRVTLTADGREAKQIGFRDLDALSKARRSGLRIALVTGEQGPLVEAVATRVGAEHVLSGAKDKHAALHELAETMNTTTARICFVGDADRDAAAFGCVGLALAPRDASPSARSMAHRVLVSEGGSGAVEEAVGVLLAIREDARSSERLLGELARIAEDSVAAHQRFVAESLPTLSRVAQTFARAIRGGNKILFCGNGGSAADAQHVAGELVGRFLVDREPWPAISLCSDTSILTAIGNDWEFSDVFARQVRALVRPGDVVVGISTSGRSENVLRAMREGKRRGAVCVGFTGSRGWALAEVSDVCFAAPAEATPRIQELHILAWHGVCQVVEALLTERAA